MCQPSPVCHVLTDLKRRAVLWVTGVWFRAYRARLVRDWVVREPGHLTERDRALVQGRHLSVGLVK